MQQEKKGTIMRLIGRQRRGGIRNAFILAFGIMMHLMAEISLFGSVVMADAVSEVDDDKDADENNINQDRSKMEYNHSNKCSWGVCNDDDVDSYHDTNRDVEKAEEDSKEEAKEDSKEEELELAERHDNPLAVEDENKDDRPTAAAAATSAATTTENAHIPFIKSSSTKKNGSQKRTQKRTQQQAHTSTHTHMHGGPKHTHTTHGHKGPMYASKQQQQKQILETDHHDNTQNDKNGNKFVPPEGFVITNRVYTDPDDKLAHFDDGEDSDKIQLPYWECSATGSTTTPLPVRNAYFRHALCGSHPTIWSGTEYGPHPQLVIALKEITITLNSGESKTFHAGNVILLEDVVSGGHKIMSQGKDDMEFLLLTLPQHYHHVGKHKLSIKKATTRTNNPCLINNKLNNSQDGRNHPYPQQKEHTAAFAQSKSKSLLSSDQFRLLILGTVGVSISTLAVDFLGKVAPLWLAVGIGGTCFVVGGTYGFVKFGEYLLEEIETRIERRRLGVAYSEEDVLIEEEYSNMEDTSPPIKPTV